MTHTGILCAPHGFTSQARESDDGLRAVCWFLCRAVLFRDIPNVQLGRNERAPMRAPVCLLVLPALMSPTGVSRMKFKRNGGIVFFRLWRLSGSFCVARKTAPVPQQLGARYHAILAG